MSDNEVIAASDEDWSPLPMHRTVRIRRERDDPITEQPVVILRRASREEYVQYHEREGLAYDTDKPDLHYYAILMD